MRTQQYIQLNTGAKETQQLTPNQLARQQTQHQAPTLSYIDKSLSWDCMLAKIKES